MPRASFDLNTRKLAGMTADPTRTRASTAKELQERLAELDEMQIAAFESRREGSSVAIEDIHRRFYEEYEEAKRRALER